MPQVLSAILFRLSGPVTVDHDETVTLGALQTHPVLSALTEIEPAPAGIDTSAIGEKQLSLTFFGFLPRTVTVSVCDLTLPAVTAYRMTVGVGAALDAADCVLSCEDKTAVTHTFAESPDTSGAGTYTCLLLSTDAGGNTVQTEVSVTVADGICTQTIEFGTDAAAIAELLSDGYPAYPTMDLTHIDAAACGAYRVVAQNETERAVLSVILSDTTPPKGRKHNFNLLSGTTLTPEDFETGRARILGVAIEAKTKF